MDHNYEIQEARGLEIERKRDHDARMAEGPLRSEGFPEREMRLNFTDSQMKRIESALSEFGDDERSTETKLCQICGEWKAHQVDRNTRLTGKDLPLKK